MDPDDEILRTAVQGVLVGSDPADVARRLSDGGFVELLAEDPAAAIRALFEEQGSGLHAGPALDIVALHELGVAADPAVAVLYPAVEHGDRPSTTVAVDPISVPVDASGVLLAGHDRSNVVAAPARRGDRLAVAWLERSELEVTPVSGLDRDLRLAVVHGRVTAERVEELDPQVWERAIARCQVALAYQLIGVARATLDLAVGHVTHRHQFGKPLAVHQAVRHRLADVAAAIAAADEVAGIDGATPRGVHARTAKALAGRAASVATEAAMQVCGGMGFTWEFPLHRYVRRAQVLDSLLGSSRWLEREIGGSLVREREVPALFPL